MCKYIPPKTLCVLDGDLTPMSSLDSLQPKHIWTGWRQEKCDFSPLKIDGMHHPCISRGEHWIWMSNRLSPSAFCFEWSCRHLTPSLNPLELGLNSELILALPQVSAAECTGLCWYPQHPPGIGLVAPRAVPMVEEAQVGHQPPHGAKINKKASLDFAGPCSTFQINAGNSPLSDSERPKGVFFGLGLGFFQTFCRLVISHHGANCLAEFVLTLLLGSECIHLSLRRLECHCCFLWILIPSGKEGLAGQSWHIALPLLSCLGAKTSQWNAGHGAALPLHNYSRNPSSDQGSSLL